MRNYNITINSITAYSILNDKNSDAEAKKNYCQER